MLEALAEQLLAAEALEEDDVALVLRVRDLEHHGLARFGVRGLEDRGHPAARQQLGQRELIDLLSDG